VHGFDDKGQGEIMILSDKNENDLKLVYSDNGRGITPENQERIFDPFFTTNKKAGTGLGLHIVYNLVTQKLHGTINCESEINIGTKFIMNIPVE
jgi:signal transduction histidine kinase